MRRGESEWRGPPGQICRSMTTRKPAAAYLPSSVFPLVTLCSSALFISGIFYAGLRRGMDHVTTFGPEGGQTAISIALSESDYGLHLGYLGLLLLNCAVWIAGYQPRHSCLETSGPGRSRSRFGDFRGCEFCLVGPAHAGSLDKSEQF
jgi:hypothetical protein